MGKRCFAVRYDQTRDSKFYMCRGCHNHIAFIEDSVHSHKPSGTILLQNVDNVVIENPEDHVDIVCVTVAFVNCAVCKMNLGWKCVHVLDGPSDLFQEGKIALYLHNLLFWDGKQVLEADTMKPAENKLNSGAQDRNQALGADTMKPPENPLISVVQAGNQVLDADTMKPAENLLISRFQDGNQVLDTDSMKPAENILISRVQEMTVQEHHRRTTLNSK